mmetsp:Transcript_2792/g.8482  ORF Transcript_2792/g.8482 Transcript_2792/m.8482 type:complete len:138 (+) Transcript_2792:181-594(+)|eukprot:CAMPEP_0198724924 /NCGR_PEP_ID=MMETSP1475-20131203/2294_1 /TAXON_ID= ORGANISM="Unidentified sp., Strain CCMP1999" /NCGR_SAMPLE_ID=MMETSP1475 /ASSEMBLY_ACC=CAM_ASM_001111 /LENGTH=137 /DNA_ID=CAMNT_0044486565 /DNA_START=145 /DNA_END=558 /DNA_ORIENTATION=-
MASIAVNVAFSTGAVVLAGAVVNATRPASRDVQVMSTMKLQKRYDLIFGKKPISGAATGATVSAPTKQKQEEPVATTKESDDDAPEAEEKQNPSSFSEAKIGGDTGKPSPPTPFDLFGFRPSKLPGPPKPYNPSVAF